MMSMDLLALIAFGIYTVLFAVLRLDWRIVIALGLGQLVSATVMLAVDAQHWADTLAIWAYCFLASGAILLLIQNIRERQRGNGGE